MDWDHRDVVAESLSRGRRRDDDDVLPFQGGADGLCLVKVGPVDSPEREGARQAGVQCRPGPALGLLRGKGTPDGHLPGPGFDPFQQVFDFLSGFAEHGRDHL